MDGSSQPNISCACSSGEAAGETQHAKFVYSDRPQPWMSGTPVRASKSRATSTGSGADDTIRCFSVGTLSRVIPAASSMGRRVGTTLETVTFSARTTCAHVNGSSRSVKTRCPPVDSAVMSPKPKACAW